MDTHIYKYDTFKNSYPICKSTQCYVNVHVFKFTKKYVSLMLQTNTIVAVG